MILNGIQRSSGVLGLMVLSAKNRITFSHAYFSQRSIVDGSVGRGVTTHGAISALEEGVKIVRVELLGLEKVAEIAGTTSLDVFAHAPDHVDAVSMNKHAR